MPLGIPFFVCASWSEWTSAEMIQLPRELCTYCGGCVLPQKDCLLCAQFMLPNVEVDPTCCHYYLGEEPAPGGYRWVFPKGEAKANVGIGVQADLATLPAAE